MVIGAPYDAGASYRAGARFGPQAIRTTDYLPHDGSRPHLALRVDPLQDLRVRDAGDIEMAGVEGRAPLDRLERAVRTVAEAGRDPAGARRRPHDHLAGRDRGRARGRLGPGLGDPLRRARRHRGGAVRVADRARAADAAADRVRCHPRRPVPADRAARLLARAADPGLDGRAADALVRDGRDRPPRAGQLPRRGVRDRGRRVRRGVPLGRHRRRRSRAPLPAPAPRSRAG